MIAEDRNALRGKLENLIPAIDKLDTDWNPHSIADGALHYDGEPVVINEPGETYLDRHFLSDYLPLTDSYISQLTNGIDAWDSLTAAQKQTWFLNNFDDLLIMVRGILRFIRWLMKAIIKLSL